MTIDYAKLARLQGDLDELMATLTGLQDRAAGASRTIMEIEASFKPSRQWRPGDDLSIYLEPAIAKEYPAEEKAVRRILALREERRATYARTQALRPRLAALSALVFACNRYVAEVEA